MSEQEKAILTKLSADGKTAIDIAEALGVSRQLISHWQAELGISYKDKLKQRMALFERLWNLNVPRPQICKEVGIREQEVRIWAKKLGLGFRAMDYGDRAPWTKEEDAKLTKLYVDRRLSLGAIAALMPGRTEAGVSSRLRHLKLANQRKGHKGRPLASSAALKPKVLACLDQHGASPVWRIRDYAQASNERLVRAALRSLAEEGLVVKTEQGFYARALAS